MSKARSRGRVRPTKDPQAPGVGSKGYLRVLARGCGSYQSNHPLDPVEYDCGHEYGWVCDDCPFVVEEALNYECRQVAAIHGLQGPPREFKHPMEFWVFPSVCSELHWIYSQPELEDLLARFARIGPEEVVPGASLFSFSNL